MLLRKSMNLRDLEGRHLKNCCYPSCPSSMMLASMARSKTCWRILVLQLSTSTSIRWRYWMFHKEAQVLFGTDRWTTKLIFPCTGQLMSPLREYKTAPELEKSTRPSIRLMYEFQSCALLLSVNNFVDSPHWTILHRRQARRSMLFSICTQYQPHLWPKEFKV